MRVNKLVSLLSLLSSLCLLLLSTHLYLRRCTVSMSTPAVINKVYQTSDQEIYSKLLALSETVDIDERGKFQQTRIQKLCSSRHFTGQRSLPIPPSALSEQLYSHLLFDDERQIIFCFVPKVGCTNMKRLIMYMTDSIPMYTVDWPWVDYTKYMVPAMGKASFQTTKLTEKQKKQRISDYYKFMMVRHPLERLVSAYRDKIESPILLGYEKKFPDRVKVSILERYRPKGIALWKRVAKYRPYNISVTFAEFCRYIIENNSSNLNDHFVPSMDLCHPCAMNYSFYGNFRNYSSDSSQLIEKFKTNPKFYRDESLHKPHKQTRGKLSKYYQLLSNREKVNLIGRIYDELLFYFTLYPGERDSLKEILDMDLTIK